jgi:hypothetical protein
VADHPHWCGGPAMGCDGACHRSAPLFVAVDERSKTQVVTGLCGRAGRVFVQLVVATVYEDRPLILSPDPVFVQEPHAHDLTVDQAIELHRMLSDLLAQARR